MAERERAPNGTARVVYQTQCIRNPHLDDVDYTDVAPIQAAKIRLRRAYIVAGVLIVVSLLTAVAPAAYVLASTFDGSGGGGNWTICWPCRSSSSKDMCCATKARTDLRCSTITAVLFHCCCCC